MALAPLPNLLALIAADLCKNNKCDSREFDDCFEMGNGEEVVCAFIRLSEKPLRL